MFVRQLRPSFPGKAAPAELHEFTGDPRVGEAAFGVRASQKDENNWAEEGEVKKGLSE